MGALPAAVAWHPFCYWRRMPRYHFKLVDGNIVSDHGTHELDDETTAQIEKLAHSLSATRPEFLGKNYVLLVTDERGAVVCAIPLD